MSPSAALNGTLIDIGLVSPQLILFLGFLILPMFIGLPIVFTNMRTFADHHREFIALQNFRKLLVDPGYDRDMVFNALTRNSIFFLINYLFVYVFGLTLALMMFEGYFGKGFFAIIYLPMMVSQLAIGYIITMLLSKSTGSLNLLLLKLGVLHDPLNVQASPGSTWALPLFIGWEFAGYNLAIFLSGLYSISSETIEASIIDGASYFQRLRYVVFPQMKESFIVATIMCITGSYQIFDQAVALGGLGGNRDVEFVAIALYKLVFPQASVSKAMTLTFIVGLPLFAISFLLSRIQKRITRRER